MIRILHALLTAAALLAAFPLFARPEAAAPADRVSTSALTLPARRHPFLFADAATFAAAKKRAERHPWAKARLDAVTSEAEAILARPLEMPAEGGQWGHYYICRKCAAELKHRDGKHVCSRCATEHTGWPFDQVAAGFVHTRNWDAVETLGLAWQLTGDARFAARAREILLAYAEKYRTYPYHDYKGGTMKRGARVFAQTLDEGVRGIHVAWGYDLVHDSPGMTDADRRAIENGFLRGIVETIRRNDMGVSNWQTWHNATLAAIGFCLEDAELVAEVLDGPSGLRFQLKNSVLPDGWWYEGAASYHFYALDALRWTTEAAFAAGIDFYSDPDYKRLYDAPLGYMFPDLTFPAVNDSTVSSISSRRPLYEVAWSRFGDVRHLPVLNPEKRDSVEALLWGAEELPAAPDVEPASTNFAGLGAAVLRQGRGDNSLYVHLDYGPHGGAHGHQDKLALILFANGGQAAPDPGALRYSAPLHSEWYRTTFAHNTLAVDGKDQEEAEGRLTLFHSEPGFSVARAECDTAYPGVRMERTVILTDGYLVDVVQADSATTRTFDWLWHNEGKPALSVATKPRKRPLGKSHGYQHLKEIREGRTTETWSADFRRKGSGVLLTMAGGPDTRIYAGTGMTGRPPEPCPMVAARRTGTSATFVTVLEPYRKSPRTGPPAVRLTGTDGGEEETGTGAGEGSGPLELTVETGDGARDLFRLLPRGTGKGGTTRPVRLTRRSADDTERVFEAR